MIVRYKTIERSLCTNFRANGANLAPCAGLIMVMTMLITALDNDLPVAHAHLAAPPIVDPFELS